MTRNNNFDLLRFLLAGMVVLFHGYVLSRNEQLVLLPRFFSADIAVKGFFVVSGYLILRSWDTSAGLADYASKRARRIYPAYATVVLSCALVGAVVSYMPLSRYFSWQWLRYLGANLVFLNFLGPTLPGVFTGNPESAVNGAGRGARRRLHSVDCPYLRRLPDAFAPHLSRGATLATSSVLGTPSRIAKSPGRRHQDQDQRASSGSLAGLWA